MQRDHPKRKVLFQLFQPSILNGLCWFFGVHDTMTSLLLLDWPSQSGGMANKSRVVQTAGFQPSKCDNFQGHLLNWLCVCNISGKKNIRFYRMHELQHYSKISNSPGAMFLQSSQQSDDSLDWTDLRRHQGLNELMLLQSTRFKHA